MLAKLTLASNLVKFRFSEHLFTLAPYAPISTRGCRKEAMEIKTHQFLFNSMLSS